MMVQHGQAEREDESEEGVSVPIVRDVIRPLDGQVP